jgi:hypothetical protein
MARIMHRYVSPVGEVLPNFRRNSLSYAFWDAELVGTLEEISVLKCFVRSMAFLSTVAFALGWIGILTATSSSLPTPPGGQPAGGSSTALTTSPASRLSIVCPSNQTVRSLDGKDVTVNFYGRTTGGVSPVNITYIPASGTQFPIGTGVVRGLAFSADGRVATCEFNVVVSSSAVQSNGSVIDAASYGIWNPTSRDTCTKAQHDSYSVIGPDGKRYPTWHPPLGPNDCTFGHEHGRDPKRSMLWPQIQQYFYYDANGNGVMDPQEAEVTGIPFGYANEQMDVYSSARGLQMMRHEDHVGHKVDWVDGEADLASHQMNNSLTDGAWVGRLGNGRVQADTGVRCRFLAKVHQGVSTPDAFTNNLHEVMYFANCTHSNPSNNQEISVTKMMAFNKPGGFTKFMPMCGVGRRDNPQNFVSLGTNAMNEMYPSGPGDREILTRDCIEKGFLVPEGSFSGNLYEAWSATLAIHDSRGRAIASGINLLFDVEDANRYYYPEDLKVSRGYTSPAAGTNLGMSMDLCYDTSLSSQGRVARGGPCELATNFGRITDITWDDPRSAFRGIHRGMYFMPATLKKAGGPITWYTDPFGDKGSDKPFPGSIKQRVTSATLDYSTLIGKQPLDPRVTDRYHDDGSGSVHAPN